jgi:hypothetical protein
MIIVKPYNYINTVEEDQYLPYKFAFLSKDFKQCHTLVKCRDFLNDAIRNIKCNRQDSIYKFSYNPEKDPIIDIENIKLITTCILQRKSFMNEMQSSISIINMFEKDAGMENKSILYQNVSYLPNWQSVVFMGDKSWVNSPFLISMYTFLIRLGSRGYVFKNIKELKKCILNDTQSLGENDTDCIYLKLTKPYLHKVLHQRNMLGFENSDYLKTSPIEKFHHSSGIVALGILANHFGGEVTKTIQEKILV